MIYSRWRPDTGGYDYFETPERFALADDLPTPSVLGGNSAIGVSSLVCGRAIPAGAVPAGSGRFAKGVIAPIDRTGLSGGPVLTESGLKWMALVIGAGMAWVVWDHNRGT